MENPKKHEINTQDIIANLRFADPVMVKICDILMSIPFLSHPMLLKILTVLIVLGLPVMAIVGLINGLASIVATIIGLNFFGLVAVIISVGYLFWLAGTTLFSKTSDLKLADLGTWSKLFVVAIFIYLIVESINNIWTRGIASLISVLIIDFITITLTLYLVPFFARYFDGPILDGLALHPDSKATQPAPPAPAAPPPAPQAPTAASESSEAPANPEPSATPAASEAPASTEPPEQQN